MTSFHRINLAFFASLAFFSLLSCSTSQYKTTSELDPIASRIYPTDKNTVWKAVVKAMKDYEIQERNQEGGFIKTSWMDNTKELNFANAFDAGNTVQAARYRLRIEVFEGSYRGKRSTKVSIRKKQQIERELMQGWRGVRSDLVKEKTILYRIGRILVNEARLERLHELREKKEDLKF